METNQGSVDLGGVIFAFKEQKPPELIEAKKSYILGIMQDQSGLEYSGHWFSC